MPNPSKRNGLHGGALDGILHQAGRVRIGRPITIEELRRNVQWLNSKGVVISVEQAQMIAQLMEHGDVFKSELAALADEVARTCLRYEKEWLKLTSYGKRPGTVSR